MNGPEMTMGVLALVGVYCGLILLASLAGGWLPLWVRMTHTRIQVATSFVAGFMLGIGVLHLVPHALAQFESVDRTMRWLLGGFLTMFFVQRYLHFHHHDVPEEAPETQEILQDGDAGVPGDAQRGHEHTLAFKSARHLSWMGAALGLTIHTLMDGIALGASVELDRQTGEAAGLMGIGTFLVIFLHKPFDAMAIGTLLASGGWSRRRRHWVNGLFALANPVGLLLFYLGASHFSDSASQFLGAMLAFAAGTFLSIATSDLLPELQFHTHDRGKLSLALLAGICASALIGAVEPDGHGHSPAPNPAELKIERSPGQTRAP